MAYPSTVVVGQTGHVADHNLIRDDITKLKRRDGLDVRDFGAVGDDVTDDYAAIQAAIKAAESIASYTVAPPLVRLMRRHRISQTLIIRRTMILEGYGTVATVVSPTSTFASNGWLLQISTATEQADRNNEKQEADTAWSPTTDRSGVQVNGITFTGRDRTKALNGIRVLRADDLRLTNVEVVMMRGHGIQLGNVDNVTGVGVGAVRESIFSDVSVFKCGDGNGVAALQIGCAPTGSSDGTNQLYFYGLRVVYNHGCGVHIVNDNPAETVRRIQIDGMQLHGLSGNVQTWDLVRIEGGVIDVWLQNVYANTGGPAPYYLVRTLASKISGRGPSHFKVANFAVSSTDGGGIFRFESMSNFDLRGVGATNVAGLYVDVPAGAGVASWHVQGTQNDTADNISKFAMDSVCKSRGSLDWPPFALVGTAGADAEAPANLVLAVHDPVPARVDIPGIAETHTVLVHSATDPFATDLGYVSGHDIWLRIA